MRKVLNSPIYRDYVISEDGKTSGIVVYLKKDKKLHQLIKLKDQYYDQSLNDNFTKQDKEKYKIFLKDYENYKNLYNEKNHQNITEIREVIKKIRC